MQNEISWVVEATIQESQYEKLKTLSAEMVSSTHEHEPGTISYEWFVDEAATKCYICERYADSAAAMKHLETFGLKFAERLGQLVRIKRVTVFGSASEEVMKALGEEGTVFLSPLTGFTR